MIMTTIHNTMTNIRQAADLIILTREIIRTMVIGPTVEAARTVETEATETTTDRTIAKTKWETETANSVDTPTQIEVDQVEVETVETILRQEDQVHLATDQVSLKSKGKKLLAS